MDENHKLKSFQNKNEVVEYFVNYRLGIYTERKKKLVKILEERIKKNDELVKFIELVCKGKLKIRNRSKADIKISKMEELKFMIESMINKSLRKTLLINDMKVNTNVAAPSIIESEKNTTSEEDTLVKSEEQMTFDYTKMTIEEESAHGFSELNKVKINKLMKILKD